MENIINIVNFIRGSEPRHRWLDLVEPIREQIRGMRMAKRGAIWVGPTAS